MAKKAQKRRIKKWTPHSPAWKKAATEEALGYCPPIIPCNDCKGPVIEGYCCGHCGSEDPR